jgi:hypothetical protein
LLHFWPTFPSSDLAARGKFTDSSVAHFVLVSVVWAGWCTTVVDRASKKF